MSYTWLGIANTPGTQVRLPNLSSYCIAGPSLAGSSIDRFYEACSAIILHGNATNLNAYPPLGQLLIVELISRTETYFRDLFSELIVVCPVASKKSADVAISVGSVLWARDQSLRRIVFEHTSLADAESLKRGFNKFLDIQIQKSDDIHALLDEYDKICELRHCIVHASSTISGKNASKLGLPPSRETMSVSLDPQKIQDATNICLQLVRASNTFVFREISRRWRLEWKKTHTAWNAKVETRKFNEIWKIFFSVNDSRNGTHVPTKKQISRLKQKCKKEIILAFG